MFYLIYQTTNKINGKKYIGKHVTNNLNDDYIGSGLVLSRALKKYGRKAFIREILFVFDNEEDMNRKEAEIVNIDVILSPDFYNCALGGKGGAIVLKEDHPLYNATCRKISQAQQKRSSQMSEIVKGLHQQKLVGMYGKKQSDYQKSIVSSINKNKPKSEDQKKKQKESLLKTFSDPNYTHPNKGVGKKKYKCMWCGKLIGGKSNYNRYHGDKCNKKENK